MTAWMLYLTVFTGLVVVSLVVMEQRQRRYMWIAALLVFAAQPALFLSVPIVDAIRHQFYAHRVDGHQVEVPVVVRTPSAIMQPIADVALPALLASSIADRVATRIALFSPLLMLAILIVEVVRTARARRRWRRATVDGVDLMVSTDFGPAVAGFFRPAIVVPEWVLGLSAMDRALLLAHEAEHLLARDSRWLIAAYGVATLAPWNVGLLWMVRRFRLALEIDCDERVLARGHDPAAYATFLLDMARRTRGQPMLAAGSAGRRSLLRARISNITSTPRSVARDMSRVIVGLAVLMGACFLAPSHPAPTAVGESRAAPAPRYVADSVVTDETTLKATRAGHALPRAFRIDSQVTLTTAENGCPSLLADGAVHLRLEASVTPGTSASSKAMYGYYSVEPSGRYGVGKDELLRVECRNADPTHLRTAGYALLDATHRVAIAVRFNIAVDTLQRVGSRLNIAYSDSIGASARNRAMDVARFAWRMARADSMRIDTVAVNVSMTNVRADLAGVTGVRWLFYRDRDLANK